jgi:hypothetical protein
MPLSKPARAVIAEIPKVDGVDYVFTVTGKVPFSNWSKDIEKIRAGAELDQPWTLHDLRRTVATGLQRLGISLQVIEAVLRSARAGPEAPGLDFLADVVVSGENISPVRRTIKFGSMGLTKLNSWHKPICDQ